MGTNPFRLMAVLWVTVGLFFAVLRGLEALPGIAGPSNLNWLRVHVLTIGTATQMIFATLPGLIARRLGTPDRAPGEAWLQWGLVNGGFVLIIAGLVGIDPWTASIGASVLFAAVWRLAAGVVSAYRTAGYRWREAMRFYVTAPFYLLVGITMAVSLLFNWWAPGGRMGTLEAHVHANVWGFLALVVAGTLLDLFPAAAGRPLSRPGWTAPIYWLLNLGAMALVAGPWLNLHPITVGGLLTYMAGNALLLLRLVLTLTEGRGSTPAALHLVSAYVWMLVPAFFAPFILFAPQWIRPAAVEAAALQGLINGWLLGIAMGALPLVLRSRKDGPVFDPDATSDRGSWYSVVALNAGVALVWATAAVSIPPVVTGLMVGGYALIALAWIPFLRRVWSAIAVA